MAIDKNARQLAEALTEGRHIVVTTLQKFPFVLDRVSKLGNRSFAVIIDEAHSSQTGESARKMREVLSTNTHDEDVQEEDLSHDFEDELDGAALASSKNVSFIALTATPKFKTIEIFGRPAVEGKPEAFHVYSMRQAIEEGFILDVLLYYATYKTMWSVEKTVVADPELEAKTAKSAIARFVGLHPHNIAQKIEIIVEHFRLHGRYKINGRAKTMIVTRSRLHAVRYKLAIDQYLKLKGYSDIRALVAFSGEVYDSREGEKFTEPGMNGFGEKQLPDKFASDEYQVLLVAEKYQTGYDQPLLQSMYVDKRLDGVKAVQTLSRLNRTHPGKEDTFILDFVNRAEEVQAAFEPYYDATEIEEVTDPNLLSDYKTELDGMDVYYQSEVDSAHDAVQASGKKTASASNAALNSALDPGVGRYLALTRQEQDRFKSILMSYVRLYAFLLHVITFADPGLERLYDYARFLLRKLPRRDATSDFQVDDYVLLRRHRLAKVADQNMSLSALHETDSEVSGFKPVTVTDPLSDRKALSSLIQQLNDKFGADLTENDQLTFHQIEKDLEEDEELAQQARANDEDNYAFAFSDKFDDAVFERFMKNGKLFKRMQDDTAFRSAVMEWMRRSVYKTQRTEAAG
jgi:type I restriction enzyme R subunit